MMFYVRFLSSVRSSSSFTKAKSNYFCSWQLGIPSVIAPKTIIAGAPGFSIPTQPIFSSESEMQTSIWKSFSKVREPEKEIVFREWLSGLYEKECSALNAIAGAYVDARSLDNV